MSNNSTSRRSFWDLFGQRMLCRLSGLLTLCWFTVAAQALYAQSPVISLTLKNATVREVIEAVKTQSGYSFWYRESEIDLRKRVSVEAHDQNVLKLLDGVLADQGILAKLEGRHIVLYKSDPAGRGREYQLKGRVETEAGDPIVGANVLVEGTTNGMVTNSKGEFALNVTAGARLSVSFIGYDAAQVEVGNRTHLTVVLKENNQLLDDVVVIGYGRAEEGQPDRLGRRAPDVGDREPAHDARLAGALFDARRLHQPGFVEARQRRRDDPHTRRRHDEQFQPHGAGRRHGVFAQRAESRATSRRSRC